LTDLLVIDTNVVVSALLKADSVPAAVLRCVLNGNALFAYDARILLEYREVLHRSRFCFSPELVDQLLRYLTDIGIAVAATPLRVSLLDPDDAKFLEVCLSAGERGQLITGNTRHYPETSRQGAIVLTPREWLDRWQGR
jgi:putative PIN family toxin of toxin-antitoxin system